ncbi:hypothetical protein AYO44_09040 [Planctomycetaceae bacterium SCGC AG-212-F19]|nr:hypothetical protein AYO44_09040 [Planctomycetaceae bacterium SCGC AG-212-F19]
MRRLRQSWLGGSGLVLSTFLVAAGCSNTLVNNSDYAQGPAPLRMPSPAKEAEACSSYEDSLTGGQVFQMYCGYCHNAPPLSERPFAQYRNVAAHMRVRANLTGKEYAKLREFLRRWNDVPPPHPPIEPSPKRLIFSQPVAELRQSPAAAAPAAPQPGDAAQLSEEPNAPD